MDDKDMVSKELYKVLIGNKLIPEWAQEEGEKYLAAFREVLKDYQVEKKK
jgi:hypothetical protein